jgi:hypothetical protein
MCDYAGAVACYTKALQVLTRLLDENDPHTKKKMLSHSSFNSLPLGSFHHQFLESAAGALAARTRACPCSNGIYVWLFGKIAFKHFAFEHFE